jgi:hypothetical protein
MPSDGAVLGTVTEYREMRKCHGSDAIPGGPRGWWPRAWAGSGRAEDCVAVMARAGASGKTGPVVRGGRGERERERGRERGRERERERERERRREREREREREKEGGGEGATGRNVSVFCSVHRP